MDASGASALGKRLRGDPAFFCREALGVFPWARQIEILEALRDHDRVAVRSGHGTGKSFVSACAALWFLYAHHPAKVVTTAPTAAQVRLILWAELRRLHAGARVPLGGTVLEERVKLGDDAFAVGLATDEAERFQGFHAEHLLVILDEAPGVRPDIWAAAETLLTGRVGKILAIGNPTRPTGRFYECFRPGSGWRTIRISCLESPNLAVDDGTDPGGGTVALPYPRLVTRRWIEARKADWGEHSAWWRSRVLGEFPEEAVDALIPRAWLEAARQPFPDDAPAPGPEGERRLGVDVARHGGDRTVLVVRDGRRLLDVAVRKGQDTMATVGLVIDTLRTWAVAPEQVFVDDTGLGAGVTDRLKEQGYRVTPVVLAGQSSEKTRFLNRRAECHWRLREALEPPNGFRLGTSEAAAELAKELSMLTYAYASHGAVKLEGKDSLRARLGASPDLADALALTFADAAEAPKEFKVTFLDDRETRHGR